MITDVLVEAAAGMDTYLDDPQYNEMYSGVKRRYLLELRLYIADMINLLNSPPTEPGRE